MAEAWMNKFYDNSTNSTSEESNRTQNQEEAKNQENNTVTEPQLSDEHNEEEEKKKMELEEKERLKQKRFKNCQAVKAHYRKKAAEEDKIIKLFTDELEGKINKLYEEKSKIMNEINILKGLELMLEEALNNHCCKMGHKNQEEPSSNENSPENSIDFQISSDSENEPDDLETGKDNTNCQTGNPTKKRRLSCSNSQLDKSHTQTTSCTTSLTWQLRGELSLSLGDFDNDDSDNPLTSKELLCLYGETGADSQRPKTPPAHKSNRIANEDFYSDPLEGPSTANMPTNDFLNDLDPLEGPLTQNMHATNFSNDDDNYLDWFDSD